MTGNFAATRYLDSLQSASRKSQRFALQRALKVLRVPVDPEQFPWHLMTNEQARSLRQGLSGPYSVSTVRVTISAVRGVLQCAQQEGLLSRSRKSELFEALRAR